MIMIHFVLIYRNLKKKAPEKDGEKTTYSVYAFLYTFLKNVGSKIKSQAKTSVRF